MTASPRDTRLVRDIAHARAGDKGDASNINVWAYRDRPPYASARAAYSSRSSRL